MNNKIYAKARFAYNNKPLNWWVENNPILENGEPAIVSDTDNDNWLKIGDGVTAWNDLPWKTFLQTDELYDPTSKNAQSGIAVAEGINLSVGDINAVLATVIGGSAVLPQSIVNKVVEKAAAGVEKQVGSRFVTAVAVRDTGSIAAEPNAAYFVISNSESGKITVYDRTTEEPVEFTGKMIGMITGNYGDTNPSSVLGLVGIYSSAIITKGTYLAIDSSKTAALSWEGEATVITVKNVKGE